MVKTSAQVIVKEYFQIKISLENHICMDPSKWHGSFSCLPALLIGLAILSRLMNNIIQLDHHSNWMASKLTASADRG